MLELLESLDSSVDLMARLSDLVFSARSLRALRDFSLDSRRDVAVVEREGRSEGRLRDCQEERADWRDVRSSVAMVVLVSFFEVKDISLLKSYFS